jgi:hypothetical protein
VLVSNAGPFFSVKRLRPAHTAKPRPGGCSELLLIIQAVTRRHKCSRNFGHWISRENGGRIPRWLKNVLSGHAKPSTTTNLTRSGDILSSVFDKLTVCWSGPVAETIQFGTADDHGDRLQIESLASRYCVSDRDVAAARSRARELLIKHWGMVERLADALLHHGRLSAAAIDALTVGEPEFRKLLV